MRKIIGVAALALAASPALAADIEPKVAAEFVLSTCLPAMDDWRTLRRSRKKRAGHGFPILFR